MNIRVPKENLIRLNNFNDSAKQLLAFTPLQYMIKAVYENPNLAEIYVDKEENPTVCLMLLGHYLFIGGKITNAVIDEMKHSILAEETRNKLGILIIFYENVEQAEQLKRIFVQTYQNERSVYYIKPKYLEINDPQEEIKEINIDLIQSDPQNLGMIMEEVLGTATYNNMEDFFDRGIGYTPVINNRVCGFCTSEYPSFGTVAIGIEVEEGHQKKGIAKAMVSAFLNKAALQDMDTYWECWKQNEASFRTALSCGFNKIADYPVLFVELKESNIRENI